VSEPVFDLASVPPSLRTPTLKRAYDRIAELQAEVERLRVRIPDPDDIRWAAARASGESLYRHVNEPNGEGEAFYARRAARLRATLPDA